MNPKPDETLDTIKGVKLFQSKRGYRFSMDAVLLENFIKAGQSASGIELGTGSGIISILLAKRLKKTKITGVEIQKSLAEHARKNISLNDLEERIEILEADILSLKKVFPTNNFDFVFSNPPFRKTRTGLISNDNERAAARHEINIKLPDLINTASYLLKNAGKFYMIYHPFRLIELIALLQSKHLEPKRIQFVHSKEGEEAKMVLIEAVKNSGAWLKVEPPLYIHEEDGEYTAAMKRIYEE
ncbi:MAG: SAM-dependent methyltransferase [Nitrospirae bacterium]|nr:SAM-dependent methyltransferase [Nitrospirota bacterium]